MTNLVMMKLYGIFWQTILKTSHSNSDEGHQLAILEGCLGHPGINTKKIPNSVTDIVNLFIGEDFF